MAVRERFQQKQTPHLVSMLGCVANQCSSVTSMPMAMGNAAKLMQTIMPPIVEGWGRVNLVINIL
jgi:hypothetical protein